MSESVKPERALAPVVMAERGIELRSMDDLGRWCKTVAESGLAPRGLDTAAKVAVAVQTGMEAGLTPMAALRSVVVINGTPSWKGEAALALVRNSGVCTVQPTVGVRGEGDERYGFVRFQRADMAAAEEVRFSVADAKKSRLWGKQGPWNEYPEDMLAWRAVARASKRYFGDVLMGLAIAEEVRDYPPDAHPEPPEAPTAPDPLLASAPSSAAQDAIDAEFTEGGVVRAPAGAAPDRGRASESGAAARDDEPPPIEDDSPGPSEVRPRDPSPSEASVDPGDSLHAEALEALRAALKSQGVTRFAQIAALGKEAGIDPLRMAACWDGKEKAIHLERLTLDELTTMVDQIERTAA